MPRRLQLLRTYHERGLSSLAHVPLQVRAVAQKHALRKHQQQTHAEWVARLSHVQRQFPRCLATSHAVAHDEKTSLLQRLKHWIRIVLHLAKLLSLASPLAISAPVVLALRSVAPSLEKSWWEYALWAAQYSSPAVMKFLQWASTRRDLFPASFCDRFERFHEHAPLHSWSQTEDALCMAFGDNWADVMELQKEPIGSGCIAQVYRGRLKATNEDVAVKVIHPHVKELVELDLDLMRAAVTLIEAIPRLHWLGGSDSVEEFASIMNRQLNLRTEAENLVLFREHFRHRKRGLRFPIPHMEYTTENVLIESFEAGLHFSEIAQLDSARRKAVARVVLESYLRMVFLDNFAHGDLHPGNLLFDPHKIHAGSNSSSSSSNGSAGVVAVDAGIVTKLDPVDLRNFVELFHAVATGDGYKAGELIVSRSKEYETKLANGELSQQKCKDLESFCHGMERIVSNALGWKLKLEKVHVGTLLREVLELCCTHEVKLEGKYASIVISIAVLEAVGRKLDPEIDVLHVALPIIAQSLIKNVRGLNN
uniref:Protein kinase domain-containing protein n=1 Tax=Globisporangium ultimum (strain ATCC 200006 / CBS 805.95 / DAOM BR144) TaxID=431595 RepID=K3WPJ5_GLOUD